MLNIVVIFYSYQLSNSLLDCYWIFLLENPPLGKKSTHLDIMVLFLLLIGYYLRNAKETH